MPAAPINSTRAARRQGLVAVALAVLALLLIAAPASAAFHAFKAVPGGKGPVKRFLVVGVDPASVVEAHLVTGKRAKAFPVAKVRRAARSRRHLVLARATSGAQVLTVTTAPQTTITAGPAEGSETTATGASFKFSSSSPSNAKFFCSLDGAAPTACSSGKSYSGLGVGTHHFGVYAVDRYGTADPSPATRSWTVKSTAPAGSSTGSTSTPPPSTSPSTPGSPDTAIVSGPGEGSASTSTAAAFWFTGTDSAPIVGYQCSLDGAAFSACAPGQGYRDLAVGRHTFEVRTVDAQGLADESPASRTWSVSPAGAEYTVPTSIASDCSTDVTRQILAWIGTVPDGSTVEFRAGGCYRIEGTLELASRELTLDGNGATLKSLNPPEDQRALWRIWNSTVTIRNFDMVGSYALGGTLTASLEHSHAIDLRGTDATIEDDSISRIGGDCVYFGLGNGPSSGIVRDSTCEETGRNGVSVVAAENVTVEHVTVNKVGYIAFDVEPNSVSGSKVSGVTFGGNTIGSYFMKAYTVIGNAPISNVLFAQNQAVNQRFKIGIQSGAYRPRGLSIVGNRANVATSPAAMNISGVEGLAITGNTVPMSGGYMADVESSCAVTVSGNSFPGGVAETSSTNDAAQCS